MSAFTLFDSGFISEENTISNSSGYRSGKSARWMLENLRERHLKRASDIEALLNSAAPEAAEQRLRAEIEHDHPTGQRCHAGCTHTVKVTYVKALVGMPLALPGATDTLPAQRGFWQRIGDWMRV